MSMEQIRSLRESLDEMEDSIEDLIDDAGELRLRLYLLEESIKEEQRTKGGGANGSTRTKRR